MNFVDRYLGTVASSYTSGGTSLVITSATSTIGSTVLPSGSSDYYIIVQAEGSNTEEEFHVTSRSGTTLTVAGAQSGTSASNHASGAVILGGISNSNFLAAFSTGGSGSVSQGTRASRPAPATAGNG